jgi:hypothetical protein
MKKPNIDMFVFVQSQGQDDQRSKVIDIANNISGIESVRAHPRIGRLVEINYDPNNVNSFHIINTIRKQGYRSVMIGM